MTLISAWPLLLLSLGVPIVLAFLRRPPPRRRVVSSLLLYRALGSAPSRRRRPPLRELIALALFLLALLSATAGLSLRPDPPPRALLAVVDTSASSAPRREAALSALSDTLRARPGASLTAVTTAPARLLFDRAEDHAGALARLRALPSAGEEDAPALLALLAALCDQPRPPLLLALHDASLPEDLGCPVERPALPAVTNRGITALSMRRADSLGLVEAHLETSAPGTVRLTADGIPAGEVTVESPRLLRLDLPQAATLRAELTGGDGWSGDDAVTAPIPDAPRVRALLLTDSQEGFAAAALGAHPAVDLTVSAAPPPGGEDAWDLLVVEGDREMAGLPSARRVVALGADAAALGIPRSRRVRRPAVRPLDEQAALLRFIDLEALHIGAGWSLRAPADSAVLVASEQGPLMVQTEDLLVVGFTPEQTDLVLRPAFINLMVNVVEWATPPTPPSPPPEGALSAAETLAAAAEPPAARSPDGADGAGVFGSGYGLAAALAALLMLAEWPLQWLGRRREGAP